jgi:hypothetical protein
VTAGSQVSRHPPSSRFSLVVIRAGPLPSPGAAPFLFADLYAFMRPSSNAAGLSVTRLPRVVRSQLRTSAASVVWASKPLSGWLHLFQRRGRVGAATTIRGCGGGALRWPVPANLPPSFVHRG